MKTDIKYLFKISLIIAIAIFIIERLVFRGDFNLPLIELFKIFGIHFMYALVLTSINGFFYKYVETKFSPARTVLNKLIQLLILF